MCDFKLKTTPFDMTIPINGELCGIYKRSFCYRTMKERYPSILSQIIQHLLDQQEHIYQLWDCDGINDLKEITAGIEELKMEVQTDKPLRCLLSIAPDAAFYHKYLNERKATDGTVTYFYTIWIFAEAYIYRRIRECFEFSNCLKSFDPFRSQKKDAYYVARPLIIPFCRHLLRLVCPQKFVFETESGTVIEYMEEVKENRDDLKRNFIQLLKLNLWGNKCDLSLSNGLITQVNDPLESIELLDPMILCNQSHEVWNVISHTDECSEIIDVVLDNAGYELFSDLCLADYLMSKGFVTEMRFYVKTIPWFISDVMLYDFHWLIKKLKQSDDIAEQIVGERWDTYVQSGTWKIIEDFYWTLPYGNSHMEELRPELYKQLSEARVVFFKGDLNYRKLFGDINWRYSTSAEETLKHFMPTQICCLRTIKCNCILGLPEGVGEKLDAHDPSWVEKGDYGVIQFICSTKCRCDM